jgi:hypothetical protein
LLFAPDDPTVEAELEVDVDPAAEDVEDEELDEDLLPEAN